MFANLKNKLIEEVKSSPSKFQQFANAAQAAVSSSNSTTPNSSDTNTTTTNENFFSITEEDTPQNSPYRPLKLPPGASLRGRASTQSLNNGSNGGAVPRTRKLSNSSMASDISFRLPSYDSPAVYHLQSDLDISGSEMDDSSTTARLEVITKEQLYDAYKKSLDRYHKYRCRYTDLAKKYKDLERDSSKARSVLVETQEKAIRRISELREQCSLEQQAKAHLEEALRVEMDDMNCKMQAYQTKLKLMGDSPENVATPTPSGSTITEANEILIDLSSSSNNTEQNAATPNGVQNNSLMEAELMTEMYLKITELEKQLGIRDHELRELRDKCAKANTTIATLKTQEEENVLLLAQTKQAIHTELEQKENEVRKLKDKLLKLELDIENAKQFETKLNDNKQQLKKLQNAKQESDAKLIATEHVLNVLKTDFATKEQALKTAEEQLKTLKADSDKSLLELRQQNEQFSEMVQRYQQNEVSLAEVDNELNRTKIDNDILRAALTESETRLLEITQALQTQHDEIIKLNTEKAHLETLQAQYKTQAQKIQQFETEIRILNEQNANNESDTIKALKAELQKANEAFNTQLSELRTHNAAKEKELKASNNKLNKQKKQYEQQQAKMLEQSAEIEKLKQELTQREEKLNAAQQIEIEKIQLEMQVTNILQEITQMELLMREVKQSHNELEQEKRTLESKIEHMQEEQQASNEVEARLQQAELKLQNVESENTQLAERNCLLEENTNRLEKQLSERVRQQTAEEASASEMRQKLDTAEDAIQKLNEKMSQVLDENSHMHNAQELMDHDYRRLQDKYDSLEKEKLLAQDALSCVQNAVKEHEQTKATLEEELRALKQNFTQTTTELNEMKLAREQLLEQLNALQCVERQDENLAALLDAEQQRCKTLTNELTQLNEQMKLYENKAEALERATETQALLRTQCESLKDELDEQNLIVADLQTKLADFNVAKQALNEKENTIAALREQLENNNTACENATSELENLKSIEQSLNAELEANNYKYAELEKELQTLKENTNVEIEQLKANYALQLETLEAKCKEHEADTNKLHESNDAFQLQIDTLNNKNQLQIEALQKSLDERERQLQSLTENAQKIVAYDQMQIEVEYLNKHTKQLEAELTQAKADHNATNLGSADLKEKLKSLQCELYVLQENAERHELQLSEKSTLFDATKAELVALQTQLEQQRLELERQTEHANFITQQNDGVQKDLLQSQQQLTETQQQLQQLTNELTETKQNAAQLIATMEEKLENSKIENQRFNETIVTLNKDVSEINIELQAKTDQLQQLQAQLTEREQIQQKTEQSQLDVAPITANITTTATTTADAEHLRVINEQLQRELEDLKYKSNAEISNLQQEIEDMQTNDKQLNERIMELERMRAGMQAQQLLLNKAANVTQSIAMATATSTANATGGIQLNEDEAGKEVLESKLKEIMTEVQDVNNRNLFLEQQCENYLILEQSNERLKLQNSKLSRQLDETLVSMQHNESITANTEFEYLKNIMFQYLTGTTNNETLVKVISAVLKFSPQQTQVALEKEHQRRSLLNKIL